MEETLFKLLQPFSEPMVDDDAAEKESWRKLVASTASSFGCNRCGETLSYLCPHCNSFPLEGHVWWVSEENGVANSGAQSVEKHTTGSNHTGF